MALHFHGKRYENCREMGCYSATLGPFCVTHAGLSDERCFMLPADFDNWSLFAPAERNNR